MTINRTHTLSKITVKKIAKPKLWYFTASIKWQCEK